MKTFRSKISEMCRVLISIMLLVILSEGHAQDQVALTASETSQLAKDLTGSWVLAGKPGNFEENPQLKGNQIMFRAGGQWCVIVLNSNGRVPIHHGGTYTLNGDEYITKVEYATIASFINHILKFKVKVDGVFYTQTGIGNIYTQVWKRLKVSPESQLAKDLTGAWILAGKPDNFKEDPQVKGNQIKFISGGQWCLTQSDPNGRVNYLYGGTYTLNGDEYIEKIEYVNENTAYLINQTSRFKMKVEGDTCTQADIENSYSQVWKRLKVSSSSIESEQTSPSSGGTTVPSAAQDGSADVSAQDQKLLNIIRDMQAAHNNHNLEAELSFYTDDAQFEVVGGSVITGKARLRSLFTQDAQRNSQLTLTDFKVQGNIVFCKGKEQNDRITEQGLDCVYFEECRFTFRDGLIHELKSTMSR